jgi:uroporphyrinogen decarboxylase
MRQAGRYMAEYNEVRRRAGSFLALCKTPSLATEVTLQPLARFPLDAAILFSDILTIPDAMGLGLYFAEGEGPRFERPLRDEAEIVKLSAPDPAGQLSYVTDAVRQIRRALAGRVPLIGFAGSPYTLACYMIEGGASDDWSHVKLMLYQRPDLLHRVLAANAQAVAALLNAQIEAGIQVAMIFDTWGGSLPAAAYAEFSLAYIQRVLSQLKRGEGSERVPLIVFTKGGTPWIEKIAAIGCDCVGLDWSADLGDARARIGARVALQGNLDPMVLLTSPDAVRREAENVLAAFGPGPGHVFNLGHGIPQRALPENVAALVAAVHELSPRFHPKS